MCNSRGRAYVSSSLLDHKIRSRRTSSVIKAERDRKTSVVRAERWAMGEGRSAESNKSLRFPTGDGVDEILDGRRGASDEETL